jgi:hypothetical protein
VLGVTASAAAVTVAANYAGMLLRKHDRIIKFRRILGGEAAASRRKTQRWRLLAFFPTGGFGGRKFRKTSNEFRRISPQAVTLF